MDRRWPDPRVHANSPSPARPCCGSPARPRAAASLDAITTNGLYPQILAVFTTTTTTATSGIRAKDVCLALDTDASAKNVEKTRSRLKRLVNRQILAEPEPGLFTLAHPGAATTTPEQRS